MAAKKAFPLRIGQDLYRALRKWAEADFRSVNGTSFGKWRGIPSESELVLDRKGSLVDCQA